MLRVFSVVTLIASGAIGLAGGTTTHASTPVYSVTNLGTLGGSLDDTTQAYAINDKSQIVGYASPPNSAVHAFLYQNRTMHDLGALGDASVAEAINNLGVIVGSADVNGGEFAVLFSGGTLQDLNNLIPAGSGMTLTEAIGINDKGQIICNGDNSSGYGNAFLLTPK